MAQILRILMTFGVGAVGFVVFRLLKIPNPALLGAMFCTGLMNIAGLYPAFPLWPVSFSANVVIGVMLGRQIDRNLISRIRDLALYVVSMTVGLMLLSLLCGLTFFKFADVSLKTALVATSAGGITEMMIFGMSINADLSIVACLQLFRVVIFLTLIPFISVLDKGKSNRPQWKSPENLSPADCFSKVDYVLLTFVAFIGAGIAAYFKIPTGAMLGAMVASGIFAVVIKKSYCYDARLRFAAQIGLGVVMGQRMTYAMISQLGEILAPALLTTAVMLAGSIALAFLLRRLSGWDMLTCLLCAAPAGLSQITAFAEEIGVDSFTASVFHTVRILSIVIIYPWIILWAI